MSASSLLDVRRDDPPETAGPPEATSARPRLWSRAQPPRAVWWATALFVAVLGIWTIAVPAYRAPDEHAHVDLVLYLAEGHSYPRYDGRYFGRAMELDDKDWLVDPTATWPRFDAADAVPRRQREDVAELGGVAPDPKAGMFKGRPDHPYLYNQMPQHPPLYYYGMAGVLAAERWILPGSHPLSLDAEVGLLRLANVLLVAALPLLAWATARRLGADDGVGVVAALIPLALPQLAHVGASVNNDNLFVLLGGVLAVLLAGVARGRRGWRSDVAVGVVLALALLTKAFAVMFLPWVVVAYGLAWWRSGRSRGPALGGLLATGIACLFGLSWWVANWINVGQPAPTTENLTRLPAQQPPDDAISPMAFAWTFTGELIARAWAWVGSRNPKFELPVAVVVALSVLVGLAVLRAFWARTVGRRDIVVALLPVALVTLFVARRSWGLYETNAKFAFIQGRYLFGCLVGPCAVVAVGAVRALGTRKAAMLVLAAGLALQADIIVSVVRGSWTGSGALGPVDGALAWSPWPPVVAYALVGAVLAAAVWTAMAIVQLPRTRVSPDFSTLLRKVVALLGRGSGHEEGRSEAQWS
jgi:4-amino-4-deoxy-L-arabinose transferase-like glycosyltransferase